MSSFSFGFLFLLEASSLVLFSFVTLVFSLFPCCTFLWVPWILCLSILIFTGGKHLISCSYTAYLTWAPLWSFYLAVPILPFQADFLCFPSRCQPSRSSGTHVDSELHASVISSLKSSSSMYKTHPYADGSDLRNVVNQEAVQLLCNSIFPKRIFPSKTPPWNRLFFFTA